MKFNLQDVLETNLAVDGMLSDGKLVEFKTVIPKDIHSLAKLIVAIANTAGGYIVFGVDDRHNVVGVRFNESAILFLTGQINSLCPHLKFTIEVESCETKTLIILEIEKSVCTLYYSRQYSTPERKIAYALTDKGIIITSEMRHTKVFKYMTIDAFLASLYSGTWRFFEPSKWNDKYEQRFYCANYHNPQSSAIAQLLYATCVTKDKNNEAAWKVYSQGKGLGMHCLQLELDIVELRKQLEATEFRYEEKKVKYLSDKEILELHKKNSKNYSKYFNPFTFESYIELLTLKREAFTYEQEIRLFLIPYDGGRRNSGKKATHKDISVDWSKIIKSVRLDKNCSDAELVSIQQACFLKNINPIINGYHFIGNRQPTCKCRDVIFERFDINDMPGGGKINIM